MAQYVGSVDSIGNVIFLAGEERYATADSIFMFHGVARTTGGPATLDEKTLGEWLESVRADNRRLASIIRDRSKFTEDGQVEDLFLRAVTKDAQFAKAHGIIHDIRDPKVQPGAPVLQLVFQRKTG